MDVCVCVFFGCAIYIYMYMCNKCVNIHAGYRYDLRIYTNVYGHVCGLAAATLVVQNNLRPGSVSKQWI